MAKLTFIYLFGPKWVPRDGEERESEFRILLFLSLGFSEKYVCLYEVTFFIYFCVSRCLKHIQSIRSETGRWIYRRTVREEDR